MDPALTVIRRGKSDMLVMWSAHMHTKSFLDQRKLSYLAGKKGGGSKDAIGILFL
jgi:hypothetical protein